MPGLKYRKLMCLERLISLLYLEGKVYFLTRLTGAFHFVLAYTSPPWLELETPY